MEKLYIVVVYDANDGETQLRKAETEENVLSIASSVAWGKEVRRVFSVDEFGSTTHYNIVFNGRLKLEEVSF